MLFSQDLSQFALQYQGQYYPLNKPQIIIGSDQSCDVRIENNAKVLPMHAQVISQDGQILLLPMKRDAVIWVNGSLVSQTQLLQYRDEIAVGDGNTRLLLLYNKKPATSSQGSGSYAIPYVPPQAIITPPPFPAQPPASTGQMPLGRMMPLSQQQAPIPQQQALMPQQQTPMSGMLNKITDTTRYLCAAGHLSESFQDYVMRHIIYEEHKALGESYGVDMSAVVSWCQAGIKRINIRDLILTGVLALSIFFNFAMNQTIGLLSNAAYSASYLLPSFMFSFLGGCTFIVTLAIVLIIGLNIEKWAKRRWSWARPGIITYLLLWVPFGFFGIFLIPLVWGTIFVELLVRYFGEPLQRLRKDTFDPRFKPVHLDVNLERKLQQNFVTGQRNVIAYSGYKPFAGAGIVRGGWSFVINTSQGSLDTTSASSNDQRLPPLPFSLNSLYSAVEKDMWDLGVNDVLEIEGKLYVQGQYLPESPEFFNPVDLRPVTSVDPRLVEQYKEHPVEGIRYYQCMRFNFWRGEMIFTAFLRFVKRGKDLFVEANYLLLPPLDPDYYWVDQKENTPPLRKIWDLYLRTFDTPVGTLFGAPFRLLRGYNYTRRQEKIARIARNSPAFDYGAATSLRQVASDNAYHLFFQELDEEMYFKIVNKQILDTIVTFLDTHQIDTTEISRRVQTILNNTTNTNNNFGGQMVVGNNGLISGDNSVNVAKQGQ